MAAIRAADLFCGAGGTSIGAHQTGGVDVSFAVNHWDIAIQTHSRNFPDAKHVQTALRWVQPSEAERINLLFASPECTHHSRARGGRPTTDQQRSGAWELMPWVEYHRPSYLVVENVVEFQEWGPVDPKTNRPLPSMKGRFFEAWVAAIQSAGYRVEFRRLNAADFGAATSRERLFLVAKKGRRNFPWPEPTHCRTGGPQLPGMELERWRGAAEIIDWSIPLPSVFGRKRPLAPNTLSRIQTGLERHVAPFVVELRKGMVGRSPYQSLGTITTSGGHHGVSVPYVVTVNHGDSSPSGRRSRSTEETLPTITGSRGEAVLAASMPMVMAPQSGGTAKTADCPVAPITTMAGSQLIVPWLTSFYGTQNTSGVASPCPTITTVDRHAATAAFINGELPDPQTDAEIALQAKMRELGVVDIGFRMLANSELAAAQGFPLSYQFCGTKKDVTKQIGNSVSPPVARAITEALLS